MTKGTDSSTGGDRGTKERIMDGGDVSHVRKGVNPKRKTEGKLEMELRTKTQIDFHAHQGTRKRDQRWKGASQKKVDVDLYSTQLIHGHGRTKRKESGKQGEEGKTPKVLCAVRRRIALGIDILYLR